ncbi:MAG: hypothetical protein IJK99_05930, partial [Bacteroidales bacterium]|nr:hypothetical protein [Bacteroidales bacterium]
ISMHIVALNDLTSRPLPRHPLSERGARRAGCVAPANHHPQSDAMNKNPSPTKQNPLIKLKQLQKFRQLPDHKKMEIALAKV